MRLDTRGWGGWAEVVQDCDFGGGEEDAEHGEDKAGVPHAVGHPVGFFDGGPGEGADDGGGEDSALGTCQACPGKSWQGSFPPDKI